MEIIHTHQSAEWLKVLSQCAHDIYHLPGFHFAAERNGEGEAKLFVYRGGGFIIALPLLLRPLDQLAVIGEAARGWKDATSVYGYSGPVVSDPNIPDTVRIDFQRTLDSALRQERVVSVFSRFHPLLAQTHLVAGLGDCLLSGTTVSIDLTLSEAEQRARYRRDHRKSLRQLRESGVVCRYAGRESMPSFVHMYRETMSRIGADQWYFFDDEYFNNLLSGLGFRSHLHLFLCELEGKEIASMLVGTCCGIAQTFLSASLDGYTKYAPTKLAIDTVRSWATNERLKYFHLGGGVGGKRDSLFYFKAGFSDRTHDFITWRWVNDPEFYGHLCHEMTRWNERNRRRPVSSDYFPEYRCNSVPMEAEEMAVAIDPPRPSLK
ncbi:MAG: GNAT family N-acetyltransferase [Verrucomicrobiota bacterium]